jgi:molecular chaperone GrpE
MSDQKVDKDEQVEDAEAAEATPEGETSASASTPENHDEVITELEDELGRARARYQDYRRRIERDAPRQRKLVAKELWSQVLPIIDNFGAALSALDKGQDAEQVLIGVKMIHQMMERLLEDNGVKTIASVGETFDPHLHEAISREVSPDHSPNTIIAEVQRGYQLDDLIVRPAKVTVAQSASENAASEDSDDDKTQD